MTPASRKLRRTRSASRSPKRAKRKTARNIGRSSPFTTASMEDEKPSPFADLRHRRGLARARGRDRDRCVADGPACSICKPASIPRPAWCRRLLGAARSDSWRLLLMARSVRAGALAQAAWPKVRFADHWRLIAILALSLIYAIGLIGRGAAVLARRRRSMSRSPCSSFSSPIARRNGTLIRGGAIRDRIRNHFGLVIHYAFQDLFLVRLP